MTKKKTNNGKERTRNNGKGTTIQKQEAEIFCQLVSRLHMNMDVSILIRNPTFRNLYKKFVDLKNRFED